MPHALLDPPRSDVVHLTGADRGRSVAGACRGGKPRLRDDVVNDAGLVTLDDHDGHPSIRSLVADSYEVITF